MQFSTLILTLAPVIATVSAKCWSDGPTWGAEIQLARDGVNYWCDNTATQGGGLSGQFTGGQMKTRCTELDANKRATLTAQWTGQGDLTLNDQDCKDRLMDEINACEHGGRRTTSDWYFNADPNDGGCANQG